MSILPSTPLNGPAYGAGSATWSWTASTTATIHPITMANMVVGAGTGGYTYTINSTSLGWKVPKRVRNGKYQVRCKSCSRWAKIIEEKQQYGQTTWTVHCERCLGKNEGFAP